MKVFLSYTRSKDAFHKVSDLRDRIEAELAMRLPGSQVFQDTKQIHEGEHFPEALVNELSNSDVLLVLLSPAWLASVWCRREYSLFTQDGSNIDRLHRILPVLWVATPQLVPTSQDPIARALADIHYSNWTRFRYGRWDDPDIQEQIGNLAERALVLGTQSSMVVNDHHAKTAGATLEAPLTDTGHTAHLPVAEKLGIVALSVQLELNTTNGLRRVIFGLEKYMTDTSEEWRIDFQLFERMHASVDYGRALVTLHVKVAHSLNAKAELAAKKGLTPRQSRHALGPAANDAKATTTGDLDEEDASKTIQAPLKE